MQKRRQYPIERSPLYRLRRQDVAEVLKVSESWLGHFMNRDKKPYNCFTRKDTKGKDREIEQALGTLYRVQKRLHVCLLRIEPPAYLFSPAKGRSNIANAALHRNSEIVRTLDIQKFFPSTRREMVYQFFRKTLQCSGGASEVLTELCVLNGRLPTGASTSPIIAFYSYKPMWESIRQMVAGENCQFSIIVDDVTVSGNRVPDQLMRCIENALATYGLRHHPGKKRRFKPGSEKDVTGVIIKNGELHMPNRLHKKLYELKQEYQRSESAEERQSLAEQIRGLKNYRKQIEAKNP